MTMVGGAANEALRDRVTRLENFVGVPENDDGVSLSVSTEQHAIELVDLRNILDDFMTETNARITNIIEDVMSLTDVVKINLKSLEDDIGLVKNAANVVHFPAAVHANVARPSTMWNGHTEVVQELIFPNCMSSQSHQTWLVMVMVMGLSCNVANETSQVSRGRTSCFDLGMPVVFLLFFYYLLLEFGTTRQKVPS
ncbi:hypothetical protein F0562_007560 [Nyssa sinensis]|uniref:Uncharacterized protein n=1 Tax=Nyssa sinensis TaxID=561372 RepID=A0A5J5A3M7_9ASTE|nr:hypothetical protein F0562_007560 [Nyssa sinensis]